MKIKYLGTAAAEGWPAIFCNCQSCRRARKAGGKNIRSRSGALINDVLMVDFSPDTYYHAINFGIDMSRLHHLVITHSHEDHFYPGDLLLRRPPFAHPEVDDFLHVYGNDTVGAILRELSSSIDNLSLKYHSIAPFETFKSGDIKVTPLLALHDRRENCYIYIFEGEDDKRILYGNDTGIFPEATWDYIKGYYFHLVSLDCTMGLSSDGNNHMGIPDNIKVKDRLMEMGCTDGQTKFILTHFSHNCGLLHDDLLEAAEPHGFDVAYDGFEIEI